MSVHLSLALHLKRARRADERQHGRGGCNRASLFLVALHAPLRGEVGLEAPVAEPAEAKVDVPDVLLDVLNVGRMITHWLVVAPPTLVRLRGADAPGPATHAFSSGKW
jgi:hypothetical protein